MRSKQLFSALYSPNLDKYIFVYAFIAQIAAPTYHYPQANQTFSYVYFNKVTFQ